MIHTQGFKEQAVQKALTRDGESLKVVAEDLNVGYSTLQKWIREYKSVNLQKESQRPQDWSRDQQFQALVETASMNVEQRSQYCREKGIFPHHLDEWSNNFIKHDKQSVSATKTDVSSLKKEIASLQKELGRKDKALAEMAALLILQKKFQALLEGVDE